MPKSPQLLSRTPRKNYDWTYSPPACCYSALSHDTVILARPRLIGLPLLLVDIIRSDTPLRMFASGLDFPNPTFERLGEKGRLESLSLQPPAETLFLPNYGGTRAQIAIGIWCPSCRQFNTPRHAFCIWCRQSPFFICISEVWPIGEKNWSVGRKYFCRTAAFLSCYQGHVMVSEVQPHGIRGQMETFCFRNWTTYVLPSTAVEEH